MSNSEGFLAENSDGEQRPCAGTVAGSADHECAVRVQFADIRSLQQLMLADGFGECATMLPACPLSPPRVDARCWAGGL